MIINSAMCISVYTCAKFTIINLSWQEQSYNLSHLKDLPGKPMLCHYLHCASLITLLSCWWIQSHSLYILDVSIGDSVIFIHKLGRHPKSPVLFLPYAGLTQIQHSGQLPFHRQILWAAHQRTLWLLSSQFPLKPTQSKQTVHSISVHHVMSWLMSGFFLLFLFFQFTVLLKHITNYWNFVFCEALFQTLDIFLLCL